MRPDESIPKPAGFPLSPIVFKYAPPAGDKPLPTYEFEFTGLTDEDKKKLRETRFILDGSNYDGIAVITPFVRTTR